MNPMQIVQAAIALVILALLIWLAFYLFIAAMVIGLCITAFVAIRRFLVDKGIVLDTAANSTSYMADSVTIETSYCEIETPAQPLSKDSDSN